MRGDRVDIDDAAADGVLARGFTDGFGIIIKRIEQLEQGGEGLVVAWPQDGFPFGEIS